MCGAFQVRDGNLSTRRRRCAVRLLSMVSPIYWIAALGGRRRPRPDSPNIAWRNASFRGYADYIASAEFADGLNQLLDVAAHLRTAIMCAEAVWWRCHRALIADVLCVRGIKVVHIIDETHAVAHPYTSPARIVQGRLSYVPAEGKPLAQKRKLARQKRLNPPAQFGK